MWMGVRDGIRGDLRMKHAWVSGLDPGKTAVRCVAFWTSRGKVAKMDRDQLPCCLCSCRHGSWIR